MVCYNKNRRKNMTPNEAKKIIRNKLTELNMINPLTARTVSFSDLARCERIFVHIYNWKPNPLFSELETIAKANGFYVEA
jgi:hypothetical protein